jgi:hypothetical protein
VNAAARLGRDHNANARTMLGQTTDAAQNDVAQQKNAVATGSSQLDGPVSMYQRGFFHRGALRVGINGTLRD